MVRREMEAAVQGSSLTALWRQYARASENLETRPVAPASPWSSGVAARLGHVRRKTFPRVRWWAIAMTGVEASTSPSGLPRWFGPRASADDPAVAALIARVARESEWADIGGAFN